MAAKTVKADYMEQVLPEYSGNPLIEALPDIMSAEETLSCLTRTPAYNQGERNLEAKYRIHCLSRLLHDYYQPLAQHLDIENRISVCLRQGYRNRNPLERQYALMVNESYEAMLEKRDVRPVPGYHPNASGFTIIGVSGVGKSTAVESILSLYPQVIEHTEYKGMPLAATQIVWLKLDCPHDGSRGELCYRFFKAVDDAVGSEFFDQYKRSRITIDSMLTLMQRIAQEYSLGLLVVDEVQHLSLAKGGSDAMLNFFVTLVNTIGVPVILIGTSKAMPILQGQFRQARRSSGHGDLIWNRMKKERNWITFAESIWKYQWIREDVPLTAQMLDAVYEETQGIIVLAVVLYVLLQEDAIRSERETFVVEDIRRVARERMALVQPMLKALRDDNKKEIDRYEDITEILVGEVTSEIRDGQPSAVKQPAARAFERVRDEVLEYFVKMRKQPEKVEEFIGQAYRESASCDFAVIAERVYELVKQDEALAKEAARKAETAEVLKEKDHEGLSKAGLIDEKQW